MANKFEMGALLATQGVINEIPEPEIGEALTRHLSGDWGDVCEEDWEANDYSLKHGYRLLSSYKSRDGVKFWIITEWDRSATTVLLPEEY